MIPAEADPNKYYLLISKDKIISHVNTKIMKNPEEELQLTGQTTTIQQTEPIYDYVNEINYRLKDNAFIRFPYKFDHISAEEISDILIFRGNMSKLLKQCDDTIVLKNVYSTLQQIVNATILRGDILWSVKQRTGTSSLCGDIHTGIFQCNGAIVSNKSVDECIEILKDGIIWRSNGENKFYFWKK